MGTPVWLASALVDGEGAVVPDWLSASERARLAAIAAPRRRAQFLAGRRLARCLLAASLPGSLPWDWALGASEGAPPVVERAPVGARRFVSITHAGPGVACATAAVPVGLDLEIPRPGRDIGALAGAVCSPCERQRFAGLDPCEREAFFLAVWTLKEAAVKRLGTGLDLGTLPRWNTAPACAGEGRIWRDGMTTLALVATDDAEPRWPLAAAPRWGDAARWTVVQH